jgi:cyclic pyranopterin phosphate synthase
MRIIMLVDDFGRVVKSMRIQVNTTCNFSCFFCHMEGTPVNSSEMKPEEIERVVEIARGLGINKIKFTGGEPLMRSDIIDIVSRTRKHVSGDISMTTNGTLLRKKAAGLRAAGLDRINISMHSIDREGFRFITGVDAIDKVRDGIKAAKESGMGPIKVNFVVLKGVNVHLIPRMIDFASENDLILQLIEYETTKNNVESPEFQKYHYDLSPIENEISRRAFSIDHNDLHNRKRYTIINKGKEVSVEFVEPMYNYDFCNNCTRIRLTSTGELKPCLMRSDNLVDILHEVRSSNSSSKLADIFGTAAKMREPYWRKEDVVESEVLRQV